MLSIENIKDNVSKLKRTLPSLNIDSIFLEKDGEVEKLCYILGGTGTIYKVANQFLLKKEIFFYK